MLHGDCDPRFARVRDAFERAFKDGKEGGAAIAVYHNGELAVDLWGGLADVRSGRPWERETPCLAWSCTKAVTAAVVLRLAERGIIDIGAPVAQIWPEFGVAGKQAVTIEQVLAHREGLPAVEEAVPADEITRPRALAARLAAQAPLWEPGTAHGYHALTYGWILGEIVRRASGRTIGEHVTEFADGMWLGPPDEVIERQARLKRDRPAPTPGNSVGNGSGNGADELTGVLKEMAEAAADPASLMNRSLYNPPVHRLPGGFTNADVLRAGVPGAGLLTTARGLARFYRDLIACEIIRPETLQDALRVRSRGPDRVLFVESAFGLGFMRPALTFLTPRAARRSAFGHTGIGGAIGLGDVDNGIGLAYIPNRMSAAMSGDFRAYALVEAVYSSIAAT